MSNPLFPDNQTIVDRDMKRLAAQIARESDDSYDVDAAFETHLEAISGPVEVAR